MYAYILRSDSTNRFYIGSTRDIKNRLFQHNDGLTKSTKAGIPWRLVYSETCLTRADAIKKERLWKSYKGGNAFKKLLGGVA